MRSTRFSKYAPLPLPSWPLRDSQENLDKGLAYLERGVLSAARRGKVSKKTAEAVKTLLSPALSIKAAKDCDLVSKGSRAIFGYEVYYWRARRAPKNTKHSKLGLPAWLEPVGALKTGLSACWVTRLGMMVLHLLLSLLLLLLRLWQPRRLWKPCLRTWA